MVKNIGILANILAISTVIGDVAKDLRKYILVIRGDLAPRKVCFEEACLRVF